jgi:hypothetical protein
MTHVMITKKNKYMRRKRFDKLACYFADKAAFDIILAIHVTTCNIDYISLTMVRQLQKISHARRNFRYPTKSLSFYFFCRRPQFANPLIFLHFLVCYRKLLSLQNLPVCNSFHGGWGVESWNRKVQNGKVKMAAGFNVRSGKM